MKTLLDKIRARDRRSLARAMTLVDQSGPDAAALRDQLRGLAGQVPWWGFTGPPGVGKSTLIDALLERLRARGDRVGVVAVDPTSPLSSGALLGDRVRMMRHAVDRDVFIRSLATHRYEGGLSDAALHCARLLELAGYDRVLIETVGVGQNEVDIAAIADICVVLLGPGYGDDIQLIKAGLLEIANLVVVNKFDLPESRRLLPEIQEELTSASCGPDVEIIGVTARDGTGVDQLLDKLLDLDADQRPEDKRVQRRHRRVSAEVTRGALLACQQALEQQLSTPATNKLVAQLQHGQCTLAEAIQSQLTLIGNRPPDRSRRVRLDAPMTPDQNRERKRPAPDQNRERKRPAKDHKPQPPAQAKP